MKITSVADSHTIPYKLKPIAKYPPIAVLVVLCLSVPLAIADAPRFLAFVLLGFFSLAVVIQLVMLCLALFSVKCREVATKSFEGKAAKMLVTGLFFLVVLSFKLSFIFWKVVLGVAGKEGGAHMYNPSIYGWSYTKNRERQSDADLP
jgi:hypothetical protein